MSLIVTLIFISSGLFLGWSMGANDASNAFGTAVATRMIRFSTAAFLCSVFLIIGAVTSGAGAAAGLGQLGTINTLPGAFTVRLSSGELGRADLTLRGSEIRVVMYLDQQMAVKLDARQVAW